MKMIFFGKKPSAAFFSPSSCVSKIYELGESQQIVCSGWSAHSLKPMKDFPVPVGWIMAAFPVSASMATAASYAVWLCSKSQLPINYLSTISNKKKQDDVTSAVWPNVLRIPYILVIYKIVHWNASSRIQLSWSSSEKTLQIKTLMLLGTTGPGFIGL